MSLGFWITAIIAGCAASPWHAKTAQKCSSYCKEPSKVKYEPGTVYNYDYVADSITSLQGVNDGSSQLRITANVEIQVETECELILRVKNSILLELNSGYLVPSPSSNEFDKLLGEHPLRFSYQDGVIESICAAPELPWILNVKRGILSSLQNSMTDFTSSQTVLEADVTGYCETNYTKISSSTIRKTKNLLGCSGRHAHQHTRLTTVPYNTMSSVQSLPLLRSDQSCEQKFLEGHLQKVDCAESHIFQPFTGQRGGAETKIHQTLTYKSKEETILPFPDITFERSSLIYKPHGENRVNEGSPKQVIAVLKDLVQNSEESLTNDVTAYFGILIKELKKITYAQMSKIYYSLDDKKARVFLTDALPSVRTAAAFAMLRDLVQDKVLTETEQAIWLTSLAFDTKPNIDMITAVAPLLEVARPSKSAFLGISSLIHHFCKSADCTVSDEIKMVIRKIELKLGSACRSMDEDSKEVILIALKALGNAGIIAGSEYTLKRCYEEDNPMEVRLSAIAAIRRVTCDFDRSNLLRIFRDISADSELRIAAYLALMKCPSAVLLGQVKGVLQTEPVNQVGSFVWTHLTNLQESNDPNKASVKELVANEFFKNKFSTDVRKFSRNIEFSSFSNDLNLGGTVESNIIFSTKSYVPRSATLNLTVDLFGESMNLLEIGGRVEGMEPIIEQIFGPDGYIPDETVEQVLKSFRGKREVDKHSLSNLVNSFEERFGVEPEASVFLRMFGNELQYSRMKGLCLAPDCDIFDQFNFKSKLNPILDFLKEPKMDYTKSFQFLDVVSSIPTVIGLPLSLSANGTSTISINMAGKVSVKDWQMFDINGYMKPEAVVNINGIMAVHAGRLKSGVKVRNTFQSAAAVDGKLLIDGTKVVSVKFNMPKKNTEIFKVASEAFIISSHQTIKPKIEVDRKKICSPEILGTSVCGEIQIPNSFSLPFASSASINLEKVDTYSAVLFDFKRSEEIIEEKSIRSLILTFDMPGSRRDKRLATKLIIDEPGRSLRFSFHSPGIKVDATGKYVYTDQLKSTDLIVSVGGEDFMGMKAVLRSEVAMGSGKHEPVFIITRRGVEVFSLDGTLHYVTNSKYGIDLTVKKIAQQPIRITGDLLHDNGKFNAIASIKSSFLESSLRGNMKVTDNTFNTKMSADYSVLSGRQYKADLTGKWSKIVKGNLRKYNFNWGLKSTQFSALNSDVTWELQSSPKYFENQASFEAGGEKWTAHQLYSKQSEGSTEDLKLKFELTCEKRDIDYHAFYLYTDSDNLFQHRMGIRVAENHEYSTLIELVDDEVKKSLELKAECPYSIAYLTGEVRQTSNNIWEASAATKWGQQEETRLAVKFSNIYTLIETKKAVKGEMTSPFFETIKIAGDIQVRQSGSTFEATVEVGKDVYDLTAGHIFDGESHRIESKVTAPDMKPVLLKATISLMQVERLIKIDINSTKELSLELKLKQSHDEFLFYSLFTWDKSHHDKMIVVQLSNTMQLFESSVSYPGRKLELSISKDVSKFVGSLSWSEAKKVNIFLYHTVEENSQRIRGKLETPFVDYEIVEIDGKYEKDDSKFGLEVLSKWKSDELAVSLSSLQDEESLIYAVLATSNLKDFEKLGGKLSYIVSDSEKRLSISTSLNDKTSTLQGTLAKRFDNLQKFYKGEIKFLTPFTDPFITEMMYLHEFGKLHAGFGINIADINVLKLGLDGELNSNILHGILNIHSTMRGYEDFLLSVKSSLHNGERNYVLESNLNKKHIKAEIISNSLENRRSFQYSLRGRLETPFAPTLTGHLIHSYNNGKISTSGELSVENKQIALLDIDGTYLSLSKLDVSVSALVPGYNITSKLKNVFHGAKVSTGIETSINGRNYLLLTEGNSQSDRKSKIMYGKLKFSSPSIPETAFHTEYTKKINSISSFIQLTYGPTKHLLNSKIVLKNALNFEGVLQLDSPFIHTDIKIKQLWNSRKVTHDVLLATSGDSVEFASLFDIKSERDGIRIAGSGSISTTWSEDVKFNLNYANKDGEYKPEITITYGKSKSVKLVGILTNKDKLISLNGSILPNFCDPVTLSGSFDNTKPQTSLITMFEWQKGRKIEFDYKGIFSYVSSDIRVSLKTPLQEFHNLGFIMSHDLSSAEKRVRLITNVDNVKLELQSRAGSAATKMFSEFSLFTPIRGFEVIGANGVVDFNSKKAEFVIKFAKQEIKAVASYRKIGDKILGYLKYTNPFSISKSLSLDLTYDSARDKKIQAVVQTDKSRSDILIRVATSSAATEVEITANTPIKGLEKIAVKGSYDAKKRSLLLNARKNSAEIIFQAKNPSGLLEMTLSTPFEAASNMVFSAQYTDRSLEAYVGRNAHKYTISASYKMKQNRFEATGTLTTPFKEMEKVTAALDYDWSNEINNGNIVFQKDTKKIEVTGSFNIQSLLMPSIYVIIHEGPLISKTEVSINYNIKDTIKTVEMKLVYDSNIYHLSGAASVEPRDGYLHLLFNTPLLQRFELKANYDMRLVPARFNLFFQKGTSKIVNIDVDADLVHVSANASTVIPGYENLSLNASIERAKTSKFNLHASKNADVFEIFFENTDDSYLITLKTPFEGLRSFSIEGTRKTSPEKISYNLNIAKGVHHLSLALSGFMSIKKSDLRAAVSSNIPFLENYGLRLEYDFLKKISGSLVVERNKTKTTLSGDVDVLPNGATVRVVTPFIGYREVEVSTKLEEQKAELSLKTENKLSNFSVSLFFDDKEIAATIRTSIPGFEMLSAKAQYALTDEKKYLSLTLSQNSYKIDISSSISIRNSGLDVEAYLSTYLRGFEKIELTGMYDKTENNAKFAMSFQMNAARYEASLVTVNNNDFIDVKATFSTPHKYWEDVVIDGIVNKNEKIANFVIDRNGEKKKVSGKLDYEASSFKATLNTPFQGLEIISIAAKYDESSLEAGLHTPFKGFETISFGGSYDFQSESKMARVILTKGINSYESVLRAQLTPREGAVSIQSSLPITGFETSSFDFVYDLATEDNKISTNINIQQDMNHAEMSLRLQADESSGAFTVVLITPFRGFEDLEVNAKYSFTEPKMVDIRYETKGNAAFLFAVNYGASIESSDLGLSLLLPAILEDKLELKFKHNLDTKISKLDLDLVTYFNGVHFISTSSVNGINHGKLDIISSNENLGSIQTSWKLVSNRFEASINKEEKNIVSLYIQFINNGLKDFVIRGSAKSILFEHQEFRIEMNATKEEKSYLVINYQNRNSIYNLLGNSIVTDGIWRLESSIKLPISGFEDVSLQAQYGNGNAYALVNFDSQKLEINADFDLKILKSSSQLKITAPFIETLEISCEYNVASKEKIGQAVLSYGTTRIRFNGMANVKTKYEAESRIYLTSNTVFNLASVIRYNFNDELKTAYAEFKVDNSTTSFEAKVSRSPLTPSVTLSITAPIINYENIIVTTEANFINGIKVKILTRGIKNIDVNFIANGKGVSVVLETPFDGLKNLRLDSNYSFSAKNSRVELDASDGENHLSFSYSLVNDHLKCEIDAPFTGFKSIKIDGVLPFGTNRKTELTIILDDKVTSISGGLSEKSEKGVKFAFVSPLTEDVELSIAYANATEGLKGVDVIFRYGLERVRLHFGGLINPVRKALFVIEAKNFDPVSISMEISEERSSKRVFLKAGFDGRHLEFMTLFNKTKDEENILASLSLPVDGFEDISLSVETKKDTLNIRMNYGPNHTIHFSGVFKIDTGFRVAGTLSTPFETARRLSGDLYFELSNKAKGGKLSAQWNDISRLEISGLITDETLEFNLETPFKNVKNIEIILNYKLSKKGLWTSAKIQRSHFLFEAILIDSGLKAKLSVNDKTFECTAQLKSKLPTLKALLRVETPFKNFESFYFELNARIDKLNGDFNLQFSSPLKGLDLGTVSAAWNMNGIRAEGELSSEVLGQSLELKGSIDFNLKSLTLTSKTSLMPMFDNFRVVFENEAISENQNKIKISIENKNFHYSYSGKYSYSLNSVFSNGIITSSGYSQPIPFFLNLSLSEDFRNSDLSLQIMNNEVNLKYEFNNSSLQFFFEAELPFYNIANRSLTGSFGYYLVDVLLRTANSNHKFFLTLNHEDNHLSGAFELDTPLISVKRTATFSVSWQDEGYSSINFEGMIEGELIHNISGVLDLTDNVALTGRSESPFIGAVDLKLVAGAFDGVILIETEEAVHKADYKVVKDGAYEVQFNAESPYIADDRLSAKATLRRTANLFELTLTTETGSGSHTISGELRKDLDSLLVRLKIESSVLNLDVASFEISASRGRRSEFLIATELYRSVHSISAAVQKDPLGAEFNIASPLLKGQSVTIVLNTTYNPGQEASCEIEASYGQQSIRFESAAAYASWNNIHLSSNLTTPFSAYKSGRIQSHFKLDSGINAGLKIVTSLKDFEELLASVKYQPTETSYDASVLLKTPFSGYENTGVLLNIPMSMKSLEPRLTVTFRNEEFSASGLFNIRADKIELGAMMDGLGQKFGGSFVAKFDEMLKIDVDVMTPFIGYEKLSWEIEGQWSVKSWSNSKLYVDYQGKRIELITSGSIEQGVFVTKVELKTPFIGFESIVADIQFERTDRKTLKIELELKGKRTGITFDYLYSSLSDFLFKATLNIPLKSVGTTSIEISNRLSSNSYSGTIEGQFINTGFGVTLEGDLRSDSVEGNFEARLNEQVITIRGNSKINAKNFDAVLIASTTFQSFHSFEAKAHIEKNLKALNNLIAANLNGESLFSLNISDKDSGKYMEFTNSFYPISLLYSLEKTAGNTSLIAEICWNAHDRPVSTISVKAGYNFDSNKMLNLIYKLPSRVFSLNFNFDNTSNKLLNDFVFSWNEDYSIGYHILSKQEGTRRSSQSAANLRLDLPKRSFGVELKSAASRGESSLDIDFLWNALRDPLRRTGFTFDSKDKSSWGTTSRAYVVTLRHFKLNHDIIVKADYTWASPADVIMIDTSLQYSNLENELMRAKLAFSSEVTHKEKIHKALVLLQHLESGLNFEATSEMESGNMKVSGFITVDYLNNNKEMQRFNIALNINQKKNKLLLEASSNGHSVELIALFKKDKFHYTGFVQTSINKELPLKVELKVDLQRPAVRVHTHLKEKTIRLYLGFPTDKEVRGRLSHDFMGKTVIDGSFSVRLQTAKLLANRITWRSESFQEYKDIVYSYSHYLRATSNSIRDRFSSFVREEKISKLIAIKNTLLGIFNILASSYKEEIILISEDLNELVSVVNDLYKNDAFFIRSLYQVISTIQTKFIQASTKTVSNISCVFSAARDGILKVGSLIISMSRDIYTNAYTVIPYDIISLISSKTSNSTIQLSKNIYSYVITKRNELNQLITSTAVFIDQNFGHFEEALMNEIDAIQTRFSSLLWNYLDAGQVYLLHMKSVYEWTKDKVLTALHFYEDSKSEVFRWLVNYPLTTRILKLYKTYYSWLEEIHFDDYVQLVVNEFRGLSNTESERFKELTGKYQPYVRAAVQLIKGQYDLVKQVPPVAYFSTLIDRLFIEVDNVYSVFELKEELKESLRNFLRNVDNFMLALSDEMKGAAGNISLNNMMVSALHKGKFEASLRLPMEWKTLKDLPDFETLPVYKKAHLTTNQLLDYIDFSDHQFHFLDQVARFRPDIAWKNVVPPFGSHAMIAGNQHYMTFDRKYFEFAGECSYLLVSDFADGNFSVVVNYEGSSGKFTKKSLSVISNGHHLEITSSKVVVDGKRVELPYEEGNISIYLDGHRITLKSSSGTKVECNLYRDVCTVHITGWSFGKTVGLFGIYNYEASDDLTMPNRELRGDDEIDSFSHSWNVGSSRCRVKNVASIAKPGADPKGEKICNTLFEDESSFLRPCYNLVDATPYKTMCYNDLAALVNSAKQDLGACTAATAYAMECRQHGVDLWVPPMCVRCELKSGNVLRAGETIGFGDDSSPAPKSADIVLLVEQKGCLKNTRIGTISMDIDHALKEAGYLGNRYAVVTFGGKGVFKSPHSRTADSEIWSNRKIVQKAFEGLPFNGNEQTNAIEAMNYATRLAYRAGVSKHIILISCESSCESKDYGDAVTLLLENDFKLHILRPEKFQLKGKKTLEDSKILSHIYGYDTNDIYTIRSGRKRNADKSLRRQLVVPKDFCTPLALETNGTVFDLNKIIGRKTTSPKRVIDIFARRFAATAEPAPCQRCDCMGDKDGFGMMQCQRCISPAIDRFLKDWNAAIYESGPDTISAEEIELKIKPEDPKLYGNK
ncbi:uncharacterized protein LOC136033229 isoform X1 [Artemia franciscana]|uniref:Apolipophorin n=3 Tax=Artemia franciscana TaxID=6661 RepID=A0AA88LB87_ARTSF|nr:hypothetical protein QYM36_001455 [Artemia franciscana]KAK2725009.1 hypothetical protein QYM36_001455 [Artemia franciscana]